MMKYRWLPLEKARQEIRVLDLDPGTDNTPLSGRLQHVLLDDPDKPDYETISYAWGDPDPLDDISVAGKRIPIPIAAGSALRCMRSPDKTRTLWIDCICIDQNNDQEKGHQVGLMADVFQNSRCTLAHLGDDDGNIAKRAFEGFNLVYKAWIKSSGGKHESDGIFGPFRIEDCEIQNWGSLRRTIDLVAMKAILSKPYFRWVSSNPFPWTSSRLLTSSP